LFNYRQLNPDQCIFMDIANEDELSPGERLFLEIEGKSIMVLNTGENLFAIEDICSHDNGPLGDGDIEDKRIICPRHGAQFDLLTGKALTLPAVEDIPAYPIRVKDGKIQIGLPKESD